VRVSLAVVLVGWLLVAGCGGDQRVTAGTEPFGAAADKICGQFPGPLIGSARAGADTGYRGRAGTFADRVDRFAERVTRGVASLERLALPSGAARSAAAAAFVDAMRRLGRLVVRLKAASDELAGGDPTEVALVGGLIAKVGAVGAQVDRSVKATRRIARAYGLSVCAEVL
jgi:hypothetical protein